MVRLKSHENRTCINKKGYIDSSEPLMSERDIQEFEKDNDADFAVSLGDIARFGE